MVVFGAGFAGPVLHHWYKFLDRNIRLATQVQSLIGRVAVDQIFFAPCFIASFFVGQGLLAGESRETIQARLNKVKVAASNVMQPRINLIFLCTSVRFP